ncbi:50S ribosomal protein L19 [candidate division GN15 bacterium]|nr:50S ribosomal protein L19 [candidate division GN15 bacterium]
MKQIAQVEQAYMRDDLPPFGSGDTVRVHVKIKEGDKERIQVFQGTVISRRGGGTGATFTVRKMSSGIGVERVFPACSPNIDKVELVRKGSVRRKKLYYLRDLTGKSARIKEQLTDAQKIAAGGAASAAAAEAAKPKAAAPAEAASSEEEKSE